MNSCKYILYGILVNLYSVMKKDGQASSKVQVNKTTNYD